MLEHSVIAVLLPTAMLVAAEASQLQVLPPEATKVAVPELLARYLLQVRPVRGSVLPVPLSSPVTAGLRTVQLTLAVQLVVWVTGAPKESCHAWVEQGPGAG